MNFRASSPGAWVHCREGDDDVAVRLDDRLAAVATGEGKEFWHNQKGDRDFSAISAIRWTDGDHVIFEAEPQEWTRWYSISVSHAEPAPVVLTPGEGAVEQTAVSPDGGFLYYATNAGDIERRHVWKVPTAGGATESLTSGETIETYPAALASGRVAILGGDAKRPFGVGLVPAAGGAPRYIYPALSQFPLDAEVIPQLVLTKAADGTEIHNQLFVPKDLKPGEKRPAIVFVHGGPVRQMLLGYHYMHFYHVAYAVNQWLASRGYVVMSINYRSGIGYGKSFRTAPNTGGRGNAEYQDVLAGGKYLQTRPDVDSNRVGIWGLSYGGVLTAQALARNSDIFKVGVDMAGVHLWGSSLDPDSVSYKSSVISAIDTWKSPVLLEQGDDDRNVQFSQMTGLVQLLRAHNVYHEVMVFTDGRNEDDPGSISLTGLRRALAASDTAQPCVYTSDGKPMKVPPLCTVAVSANAHAPSPRFPRKNPFMNVPADMALLASMPIHIEATMKSINAASVPNKSSPAFPPKMSSIQSRFSVLFQ
jgi:dipeptidyl aminopeptidase/acylaminoacyl peptidase